MDTILEKKGFKLFFHNEETDVTLPVSWTGTLKGMLTKCKKLLKDNEGSHFEMTFDEGATTELTLETLIKIITEAYILEQTLPDPEPKPEPDTDPKIGEEEKPKIPEIAQHVTSPSAKPGYLFCSSKKCNCEIKIKGNLEYRFNNAIYLICPECGHKNKVSKVETTHSLSYAVGKENKGTLIRHDGPKKHMSKKSRLILKSRTN